MNRLSVYNSGERTFSSNVSDDEFYCGEKLNKLAIYLKALNDSKITLQEAYDKIVKDIIIEHVIKTSRCECSDYLHELEEKIKRQ